MPVVVLRGGLDPVSPRAWNADLADRLVEGDLMEVRLGGHNLGWSRPGAFARVVQGVVDAS